MSWNYRLTILLTTSLVLLTTALTGCRDSEKQEQPDLIILQTGRLRGNVFPQGSGIQPTIPYFAYIGGYVNSVRQEAAQSGAEVILVDLGDSLGGSFSSYITGHANMVAFFNELDYDAIALGNLDADVSGEALDQLEMPVLTPFADENGEPLPEGAAFHTALQQELGPVQLLANFLASTAKSDHPDKFPTRFAGSDEVFPLRDYAELLPQIDGWDEAALRLLLLMKFEPDSESAKTFVSEMLAKNIDCVIAHRIYSGKHREGWSQDELDGYPEAINMNILRRNSGFSIARTDLKRDSDGWRLLQRELVPMSLNTAAYDSKLVAAINSRFAAQIKQADRTVATLEAPVEQSELLANVMDLMAQADPQAARLYSISSIRTSLKPDELPLSLLYDAVPWLDPIVSIELAPGDLEKLLAEDSFTLDLPADTAAAPPTRLTTTKFFANLLDQQFGIGGGTWRTLDDQPVFLQLAEQLGRPRDSDPLSQPSAEQ